MNFFWQELYFRIQDRLKDQHIASYLNEFRKCLHFSSDEMEVYQLQKLKKLLNHAYDHVPYYKTLFDETGIKPGDISGIDALKGIKPLTRIDIQEHFSSLRDSNQTYKRVKRGSSSGSTGQAVHYLHDEFGSSAGKAAHYLGWSMAGYKFGDRGLHIWGNPAIVETVWNKKSSKFKRVVTRHDKYPAYLLTRDGKYDELTQLIEEKKFTFLDGYTNAIYLLARYLKNTGKRLDSVQYVLTTAENLHDYQREIIETYLAPVFDGYGCGEINGIAYQGKDRNGYVIMSPHVIVEYDYDEPVGDGSYPLLITDLDNRVMPLIRYKNGDIGKPANPSLEGGREQLDHPFQMLEQVKGRQSDIIDLPGGGNFVVPSFFGSVLLKQVKSIRQYQVERTSPDMLIINFVVDGNLTAKEHKIIDQALQSYLGDTINYEIKVVDHIPFQTNGKFKLLIDRTK